MAPVARAARPNVFSIAPGVPYLATFVRAFLGGRIIKGFPAGDSPLELASATLYVPTRRAARALQGEFARALPGAAALLPRIVPLGQLELIETQLLFEEQGLDAPPGDDLPEAVTPIARRLALMRMILAWMRLLPEAIVTLDPTGRLRFDAEEGVLVAKSPAQAWHLAGDLAGLIDEMIIEGIDWTSLANLVPENLDQYWSLTLRFLQIAVTQWPAHLAEIGRLDAASRQIELVDREIGRLAEAGTRNDPIVVIGSTGTNKATARLMAAIAHAPHGAVVLPGLDFGLDEAAWRSLGASMKQLGEVASHPQSALRRLLTQIGVTRDGVVELATPNDTQALRTLFISEALRPAATTEHWRLFGASLAPAAIEAALGEVSLVEAADEREEALALAIALREVAETPEQTAALITPDRGLARRVRAELARWEISVDDSGGEALGSSPYGALARLALAASLDDEPIAALALLSHGETRLGIEAADLEKRRQLYEVGIARVLLPSTSDRAELIAAARKDADRSHAHAAAKRIKPHEWEAIGDLLERLDAALAPLRGLGPSAWLSQWVEAHGRALAALTYPPAGRRAGSEAVEMMQQIFDEIAASGQAAEPFDARDYAVFFDGLCRDARLRGSRQSHPRLKILGLLEARLLDADVVLLGGLDESVWPPKTQTDAFLNRPMRAEIGLSQPERRIGQTAHDFAMAMGNPRVVISRAVKRGGAPTVASRFLQRMQALAPKDLWDACRRRGETYLSFARAIDVSADARKATRPEPKPALELRPKQLSVTRIEVLRRDPYAIYAEYILRLKPLGPLGVTAGARETGTDLHDVLAEFVRRHPFGPLPAHAEQELTELASEKFGERRKIPAFEVFRWPRMAAIFPAFTEWESTQRDAARQIDVEVKGGITIELADGSVFHLSAIADRFETLRDGRVHIVDYKSGAPPSRKEIGAGFAPQLVLEAAMLERGAFSSFEKGTLVAEASYLQLKDSGPYKPMIVATKDKPLAQLVAEQYAGLLVLLNHFRVESNAYVPRPFPQFASAYGDYDHLARVKEWSSEIVGGEGT